MNNKTFADVKKITLKEFVNINKKGHFLYLQISIYYCMKKFFTRKF